jgi:hypothetical protein
LHLIKEAIIRGYLPRQSEPVVLDDTLNTLARSFFFQCTKLIHFLVVSDHVFSLNLRPLRKSTASPENCMQGHPQRRTGQFCGILSYVLVHFAAAEVKIFSASFFADFFLRAFCVVELHSTDSDVEDCDGFDLIFIL